MTKSERAQQHREITERAFNEALSVAEQAFADADRGGIDTFRRNIEHAANLAMIANLR